MFLLGETYLLNLQSGQALCSQIKNTKQERYIMIYYHHKKRGTNYRILNHAPFQLSKTVADGDQVVIYQDIESGQVWVRPTAEFYDGRFELIEEKIVQGQIGPMEFDKK